MDSLVVSIISLTSFLSVLFLILLIVSRVKLASERSKATLAIAAIKSLEESNSKAVTYFAFERSKINKGNAALHADLERISTDVSGIRTERNRLAAENAQLNERLMAYLPLVDLDAETDRKKSEITRLEHEIELFNKSIGEKAATVAELANQIEKLDAANELQSFGFYENKYSLDTPEAYKEKLDGVLFAQKQMLSAKIAAHCNIEWTVNGSVVEGRKQTNQLLKLITRAFNGESDAAIAKVKYNNVNVMEERIKKSFQTINSLATVQQCSISYDYFNLKLHELYLVHEYREKQQAAKEEQREIRARLREEEIARREIEAALQSAERDEVKYSSALEEAKKQIESAAGANQQKLLDQIVNLERKLSEALVLKERALSRAQLTRSGHVYIISNLGAFGENVYKIGMTRRLDPHDRVLELGDASVPFRFDVHAIIYCDDAPELESKLHKRFNQRRLNRVNSRKEFFKVDLNEIAVAVREFHGEIEFTKLAEAEEYRKTLSMLMPSGS
jgi:predicted RNase H-like nuclease (RuvC/YqgF family)